MLYEAAVLMHYTLYSTAWLGYINILNVIAEEEADSETIYHLKQKIASHQKREKALQSEIMWLRMQLSPESPKEEGIILSCECRNFSVALVVMK